jgi:predicted MFS family arabinose efflux permease
VSAQPRTASGPSVPAEAVALPARWSGVLAMTLCVFALVASEFMPVSLLTPVALDLRVSEGLAGQAISVSGAFAVLTSLFIARLAGTMDRKLLLLWMTALMAVSAAVIGLATSYAVYMLGRVLMPANATVVNAYVHIIENSGWGTLQDVAMNGPPQPISKRLFVRWALTSCAAS